ncbi:MAG: hypothetical protein K0Q83_3156 [Deltaproteobacteria bacterium]|jgi:hypothetical protein|nr:hypothetical protein [Deltaproteobacteria bacterium]
METRNISLNCFFSPRSRNLSAERLSELVYSERGNRKACAGKPPKTSVETALENGNWAILETELV